MAPRIVYTDGACSRNPGPGGWAWVVPDEEFAAGAEAATTNQRMELTAVLEALRALDPPETWLQMVTEVTELKTADEARVLGDTLPIGLQLGK